MLVAYDVPNAPAPAERSVASLPAEWASFPFPKSTQEIGTAWARSRAQLALRVPSAIVLSMGG